MIKYYRIIAILGLMLSFCIGYTQSSKWIFIKNSTCGFDRTRKIKVMDNGEIWFGTYSGGAVRYKANKWTKFTPSNSGISDWDVKGIAKDSLGNYYFSTWKDFSVLNTSTNVWKTYKLSGRTNARYYSVEVGKTGWVWVGVGGGANPKDGLYRWNDSTHYDTSYYSMQPAVIRNMKTDKNGDVWFGTLRIVKIVDTVLTAIPLTSLGYHRYSYATDIAFDSKNNPWVAVHQTNGNTGGIAHYDGSKWTRYNPSNSGIPSKKIWSIAVDPNDHVWIGTEDSGLVKFDRNTWTVFNKSNSPLIGNRVGNVACDALGNVWIGFDFFPSSGVGGVLVHNPNGVPQVSGKVFFDKNKDNIQQANEKPLTNTVIKLNPGYYHAVTDDSGYYNISILDSGYYYSKPVVNNPWVNKIKPDSAQNVIMYGRWKDTANFAVEMTQGIYDSKITGSGLTPARPGFNLVYHVDIENVGTATTDSILASIIIDNTLIIDSATAPYTRVGRKISWLIDSLDITRKSKRKVFLRVPANPTLLGKEIRSSMALVLNNDTNLSDNIDTLSQIIQGSYDPNDKIVLSYGFGKSPTINRKFKYRIRFQNTGTDTAFKIVVIDTISKHLDLGTLKTTSASHPYSTQILKNGIVKWNFDNILLPDSGTNEQKSHGYIWFEIEPKKTFSGKDRISNFASIYFDFNPPIRTNTASVFLNYSLDSIQTCDSLTWINGITYKSNNFTAVDTFINASGIDSLVYLKLSLNQTIHSIDSLQACDSLIWNNGKIYYASNFSDEDTLISKVGCDSIVNLSLNVYHSSITVDYQQSCDSLQWFDGNTYFNDTSGISFLKTSSQGCDSVINLDYKLLREQRTDSIQSCQEFTWVDGNTYFRDTNHVEVKFKNQFGCDSILTLQLSLTQLDTNVKINVDSLISSELFGSYQWLDCDNNFKPITMKQDRSLKVNKNGNYAVEIFKNGCRDTSSCQRVTWISIKEESAQSSLKIYPNPGKGDFTIESDITPPYSVEIMDLKGNLMFSFSDIKNSKHDISAKLPSGSYVVRVRNSKELHYYPVIITE